MSARPVVLVEFSPSGGLFQFAAQLGQALVGEVGPVQLWTGPDPELSSRTTGFTVRSVLPTWHPADTEVRSKLVRKLRRPARAAQLVLAWLVLGVQLARTRPRAVLFSNWRFAFEPAFVAGYARLFRGTAFGIVAHEPFPRSDARDTSTVKSGWLLDRSFAAAWRSLDVAFVLGTRTREQVLRTWAPHCDVAVIPHGDEGALALAAGESAPRPVADTEPVALFFGTWTTYKGIDVLLDAFALVRDRLPQARLMLVGAVGADVDEAAILQRANRIGNIEAIPGYVDAGRVGALMDGVRVVVTPYVRASQSGVAHLAYTFGRPVIASNVGDLPEAVHDGVTGLLVPPGDPSALAEAMQRLLADPVSAEALGAAGGRAVQGGWERAAAIIAKSLSQAEERS